MASFTVRAALSVTVITVSPLEAATDKFVTIGELGVAVVVLTQVKVFGVSVVTLQFRLATDGVKPVSHCAVQFVPDAILAPSLQEDAEFWLATVGAVH
jgi:hypothetical protein